MAGRLFRASEIVSVFTGRRFAQFSPAGKLLQLQANPRFRRLAPAHMPELNRCLSVLTFDTGFGRFRVQRFGPRQCRQDFGGVTGQQGRDGQLEAREDAAVQHA